MRNPLPKTRREILPAIKYRLSTNKPNKDGKVLVYLVVYVCNTEALFNTGVRVLPEYWDPQKNLIKRGYPERADLNLILNDCHARLTETRKIQNQQ